MLDISKWLPSSASLQKNEYHNSFYRNPWFENWSQMTNIPLLWGIQAKPNFVISQFRLYTPLEIKISTGYSVRKRFCSFSFAKAFDLELARILKNSPSWKESGDDRDGFCPPSGHQLVFATRRSLEYRWGPSQLCLWSFACLWRFAEVSYIRIF